MKKSLYAVGAAASSALLASSSAFAFCITEKSYNGANDSATCNAEGDSATINVARPGGGLNYFYTVTAQNVESEAGGVLLDFTASVVSGDRADGSFGPCNESFEVSGSGDDTFICNEADASVAFIRVFAE